MVAPKKPPVKTPLPKLKVSPKLTDAQRRKRKDIFLAALTDVPHVQNAAKKAGLTADCFYNWRRADPVFAEEWAIAQEMGVGSLHDEAMRRAYHGVRKPHFFKGKKVATFVEYSDTLMAMMLNAHHPAFKRVVRNENVYPEGVPPQQVNHTLMDVAQITGADPRAAMDMYKRLMRGEPACDTDAQAKPEAGEGDEQ